MTEMTPTQIVRTQTVLFLFNSVPVFMRHVPSGLVRHLVSMG